MHWARLRNSLMLISPNGGFALPRPREGLNAARKQGEKPQSTEPRTRPGPSLAILRTALYMICAGLLAGGLAAPCPAATKKFPVACDEAETRIVPWLEAHGFRVDDAETGKPGEPLVVLKGRRPKSADGKRIWNLNRYTRKSAGQVGICGSCFERLDVAGVSAKLRFRPAAEGCEVSLIGRFLVRSESSCFAPTGMEPLGEVKSNSKLENEYLTALKRSLGEVPEPPPPPKPRRPADREREVLFVPGPGLARPLPELRKADVTASLAGKALNVIDVAGREQAARTPVIVVLDFANTTFRNQPCLVAEVTPVLDKTGGTRNFQVYVTGAGISPFFNADFGLRDRAGMLLFSYADPQEPTAKCIDSEPNYARADAFLRQSLGYESRVLLRDLGLVLSSHPGPYRVFWISDHFGWVDTQLAAEHGFSSDDLETDDEYAFDNTPRSVSGFVENLSEAGVSIFPILLPQRSKQGEKVSTSAFERAAAKYLANLTGGFMTVAGAEPGQTLARLLTLSDDAYVVRLRAPVTGRRFLDGMPHTLKVTDEAEQLTLRRRYTVNEEGTVETSDDALDHGGERLIFPSADLRLGGGCAGGSKKSLSLWLPGQVLSAPASTVHVLISYTPSPGSKEFIQRSNLARPQASGNEAEGPAVCVELARTKPGTSFSLVALDEGTQWVGAINGRILGTSVESGSQ